MVCVTSGAFVSVVNIPRLLAVRVALLVCQRRRVVLNTIVGALSPLYFKQKENKKQRFFHAFNKKKMEKKRWKKKRVVKKLAEGASFFSKACPLCASRLAFVKFVAMKKAAYVVPDLPTCAGCGEEIIDTALQAFGMQWHSNHLACKVCGKDFSDGSKVEEGQDGYAYCTPDFVDVFAPKCAACLKPIIGEVRLINACLSIL